MKTQSFFYFIIFIIGFQGFSQENVATYFEDSGEIIIRFETPEKEVLQKLSRIISLDKINKKKTTAYTCQDGFDKFLDLKIPFEVIEQRINAEDFIMLDDVDLKIIRSWDFYPTYPAYLDMMNQFAADFPDLCEVFSIGQSVQGRELMMLKISANVAVLEAEPQFLYTGTIHGDELVGYVLLLRLADYLLSNYDSDPQVTRLLDNSEIWINPLANPDGTFRGGNHTVANSTRFNANNVDLNRNYPDPEDGPHPDGKAWQPETIAFMQLAEENNFVMSANTHGGAEVINYPWDTWSRLAADNDWWVFVSRQYADTVHQYAPSNYLSGFNNGITNGYAWYSISGGRQDYMNYFHHCREVTMELSNVKKLAASQLNAHWDWNYRSLLNYYEQCIYGISGVVTDENSGLPIAAKVEIAGHDIDNSFVFADSVTGFYRRMLEAGSYDITFSASGYESQTISDVEVARYDDMVVNVELNAGTLQAGFMASNYILETGAAIDFNDVSSGNPNQWLWEFEGAIPATSNVQNPTGILYQTPGYFRVRLFITNLNGETSEKIKPALIKVAPSFNMSDQTIEVINGIFYDSGGENGNYGNNEDFTFTFLPKLSGSSISIEFLDFNIEEHSSCNYDKLMIFDGVDETAPLIGTWCGADSPGTIKAANPQGALTFRFISDGSVTQTGWKALVQSEKSVSYELPQGWSSLAFGIQPENSEVDEVFAPVGDQLVFLSGNNGVFYPSQNINTLQNIDMRQGYILKMDSAAEVFVDGYLDPYKTISLRAGWNLFPVFTDCHLDIQELATSLSENLLVIKKIAGINVYWPQNQIYTLLNLQPGRVYLINVQSNVNYTFPECY
jgi:PKD repeat protein